MPAAVTVGKAGVLDRWAGAVHRRPACPSPAPPVRQLHIGLDGKAGHRRVMNDQRPLHACTREPRCQRCMGGCPRLQAAGPLQPAPWLLVPAGLGQSAPQCSKALQTQRSTPWRRTVDVLLLEVGVVPEGSGGGAQEVVQLGSAGLQRALRDARHAIHDRGAPLQDAVPAGSARRQRKGEVAGWTGSAAERQQQCMRTCMEGGGCSSSWLEELKRLSACLSSSPRTALRKPNNGSPEAGR